MKAAEESFIALKQAFLAVDFLAQFDPDWPAIVETDASDYALGGCVSQIDPKTGMLCLMAFYSRKLTKAELQYEIYDQEMLAIVECLKQWWVYLSEVAVQMKVFTNYKNLEYFTMTKVLNKRQVQ